MFNKLKISVLALSFLGSSVLIIPQQPANAAPFVNLLCNKLPSRWEQFKCDLTNYRAYGPEASTVYCKKLHGPRAKAIARGLRYICDLNTTVDHR